MDVAPPDSHAALTHVTKGGGTGEGEKDRVEPVLGIRDILVTDPDLRISCL